MSTPGTLLCLHGFAANRQSWLGLQSALESCRQVQAIDLPGHGLQWEEEPPEDMHSLARNIWAALDVDSPIDILGHSLGGAIAIHMAAIAPKQVRSLSLLAPVGLGQGVNQPVIDSLLQLASKTTALEWLQALVHDPKMIPPLLGGMLIEHLQQPGVINRLSKLIMMMNGEAKQLDTAIDTIIAHDLPRQVIWGRNDTINAHANADIAHFGGQWELLDNCAHLSHIEQRTRVCELIVKQLNNSASTS